jgi:chromosome segregation ATPase
MTDVIPNYRVEQQRLRLQIAEQNCNLERVLLEKLEIEDRCLRHRENIIATHKAIESPQEEAETTPLDRQRRKSQLAYLRAQIEKQELEILEMQDRLSSLSELYQSSKKAATHYQSKLSELGQTHGKLVAGEWEDTEV